MLCLFSLHGSKWLKLWGMENELYILEDESTIGQEKNYVRVPRSRRLDDKLILSNLLEYRP